MKLISGLLLVPLLLSGCFVTKGEGDEMLAKIEAVRNQTAKNEERAAQLSKQLEEQLKRMKQVVEEATRVVQRNSADVGEKVDKLQTDVGQLQGRLDDMQHASDALTKNFQDYRAASDAKLETLTNAATAAKTPPVPETPDGILTEADKRMQGGQFLDARRLYEAFINRYPQDRRAAKAQFNIGESYSSEKRYSNAIGAYAKVVDNFPKSDVVPDAMYKSGMAFYALKYCNDAKVWLQELIKRHPHTSLKHQVELQLKAITRDQKNKAVCTS